MYQLPGIVVLTAGGGTSCDMQSGDERCDDCVEVCDDSDDSASEK